MSVLEIVQIPTRRDKYVYIVRDPAQGCIGVVDPSDAQPVMDELDRRGWHLTHILNPHHHGDHTGGNMELKERYGCTIVGPRADHARIPGIDVQVGDDDRYAFDDARADVLDVPGHTHGHIAY